MKEQIKKILENSQDPLFRKNRVREYLQARILGFMQRKGAMIPLAFHGGTALRFLYGLSRFSEDLDFTLEKPGESYDFQSIMKAARRGFEKEGYETEVKISDQKTVHSALIRFKELLHEVDESFDPGSVLSIKVEVDTKPPQGAGLETRIIRHGTLLHLQCHDRPSLLAGKLHSLLQRPYSKGRDLYDLVWYLSDPEWPEPNFIMLNNALKQTGWGGEAFESGNWRAVLAEKMESFNFDRLAEDVGLFLEDRNELHLLTRENVLKLLRKT